MPNELFQPFQEAMRLAVPLTINERNIAAQERMKQAYLAIVNQKALEDSAAKKAALEEKRNDAQTKLLSGYLQNAIQSGDSATFQSLVPQIEKSAGVTFPRAAQPEDSMGGRSSGIPQALMPRPTQKQFAPGHNLESLIASQAQSEGWGPEKLVQTLKDLRTHEATTKESQTLYPVVDPETNQTVWKTRAEAIGGGKPAAGGGTSEKLPPEVKASMGLIQKFLGQSANPMVAIMASMLPQNPAMVANPELQRLIAGGVPPEIKPLLDMNLKIVNDYFSKKSGTAAPATPDEIDPLGLRKNSR